MSEKPLNPLGACTQEEIELVLTSRYLPPKGHDEFHKMALTYAWEAGVIEPRAGDPPTREIAYFIGTPFIGRNPIIKNRNPNKDKK